MFTIYADNELLYSPDMVDDGYSIVDPVLTEELNKSGSLEFILPTTNVMYDKLKKLKSLIVVKLDNKEIWWGRVLHDDKDWFNRKHVYCEGMMSYLLDSVVRPYDFKGTPSDMFGQMIIRHNKQVDQSKQFQLGTRDVTDSNDYVHYSSTVYPSTLSEIFEKLVNTHGGYVKVYKSTVGTNIINYLTQYGTTSDQVIEFGKNLLDITEYIDATNVFTVLIPLGKREEKEDGSEGERLTIASVNNGKDYIEDETAINLFGRIEKIQVWDDVTVPSNLLSKGRSALESGIEMSVTLSIKAVDLHLVDVNTARISLGDYIRVISEPHGLDKYFLCSKIVTDMQNPDKTQFTFGVAFNALTDQQIAQQKKTQNAQYTAESASSIASNVSVNVGGNYVSNSDFASYQSQVNANFTKINNSLTAVYHYKGTLSSVDELPTSGLSTGDTYNIEDSGANYSWTGSEWDKLSETVDLTAYQTKEEADAIYATKEELESAVEGGTVDLSDYAKKSEIPIVPENVSAFTNDAEYVKKSELPSTPTKVSELENDAGYLTEHQSLEGYAKTEDIPTELKNPNKLILTGAVEAEYDGSEEINIEIPSGGSDWTLLTSGELDLSTRQVGFHLSEYDAKEFMFIAKVPKTTTATTIYVQSGTGNILSRSNKNYAFNIVGHMHLVSGFLYGFFGAIDGWTANIPTTVVMNTPRTTSTSDADYFKLYNETILDSGNVVTYELFGR